MKILFLTPYTNIDADRRKAQEIVHDTQNKLRSIKYREEVEFSSRWAVDEHNLLQILNEEEPDIIHFCAAGTKGDVALVTQKTKEGVAMVPLKADVLSDILDTLPKKVRLLYLDVPGTDTTAEYIQANTENVDYCIGVKTNAHRKIDRVFTAQFYSSIGFGLALPKAMKQAKMAVRTLFDRDYKDAPELFPKEAEVLLNPEKETVADKLNILLLHANPIDQDQLFIDVESSMIQEKINETSLKDKIHFTTRWTTLKGEILDAINETAPQILHYSGHGAEDSSLVFENEEGKSALLPKEYVGVLCKTIAQQVRFVFLNACYSLESAKEAVKYVDAAIGMNDSVADVAAIFFASQFYSAIGYGLDVQSAFLQARACLYLNRELLDDISEIDIPELVVKEGIDPSKMYLISATME